MTGKMIKEILEDVCDNIFNPDPFFQQGGDMVRVGGLTYTCSPKNEIGKRISNLRMVSTDKPLEASKKYIVGGWGSINPMLMAHPFIQLLENYISEKKVINSKKSEIVEVLGM